MANFHITKKGSVGKCTAPRGRCPLGGQHFKSEELVQRYADKVNEEIAKKEETVQVEKAPKKVNLKTQFKENIPVVYGTTKTNLKKRADLDAILKSKSYNKRLDKLNAKIGNMLDFDVPEAYRKYARIEKRQGRKPISQEKYTKKFMKNDEELSSLMNYRKDIQKEIIDLKNQRAQSFEITKDTKEYLVDKSYSKASGSSYFLYKAENFDEVVSYYEKKGYEFKYREDIKPALEENFLVRVSDHDPGEYLRAKRADEQVSDPFKYTDASILVTFKGNEDTKDNVVNNRNAITSLRAIEKLNTELKWLKIK